MRRFRDRSLGLDAFATDAVVAVLELLVAARCNVIVSGATSSGKTSLLNAALGRCPSGERIVTIEDTVELLPSADHLVRLEARPPTPDGPAGVTLEQLSRTALRLRPDRLVVGEVRGPEVLALVQALNTGHDGSWSTCHANSAVDALHRLETLVIQAAPAWPLAAVRQHLTRSVDVVVHVVRRHDGARHVVEIGEVVVDRDRLGCAATHRERPRRARPGHEAAGVIPSAPVVGTPSRPSCSSPQRAGASVAPPPRPRPRSATARHRSRPRRIRRRPPRPADRCRRRRLVRRASCACGRPLAHRRRVDADAPPPGSTSVPGRRRRGRRGRSLADAFAVPDTRRRDRYTPPRSSPRRADVGAAQRLVRSIAWRTSCLAPGWPSDERRSPAPRHGSRRGC